MTRTWHPTKNVIWFFWWSTTTTTTKRREKSNEKQMMLIDRSINHSFKMILWMFILFIQYGILRCDDWGKTKNDWKLRMYSEDSFGEKYPITNTHHHCINIIFFVPFNVDSVWCFLFWYAAMTFILVNKIHREILCNLNLTDYRMKAKERAKNM